VAKGQILDAIATSAVAATALYDKPLAGKFVQCREAHVLEIIRYSLLHSLVMVIFRLVDRDKDSLSIPYG
jgi:hypothetical protein